MLAVAAFLLVASLAAPGASTAAAVTDRLPDLAMARPSDLRMLTTSTGRRLLRFTTMIVNIGAGPFETRAARRSTSTTSMAVNQRIYDTSGGYRLISTSTVARMPTRPSGTPWTRVPARSCVCCLGMRHCALDD